MEPLYECAVPECEWRNPDWRYGFADAGATWASHVADHKTRATPPEKAEGTP